MGTPYRTAGAASPASPLRCLYCGREREPDRCRACGADAPSIACAACGAPVHAPLTRCACGAACAAWDVPAATAGGVACPRCRCALSRVPLEESRVEIELCPRCSGCFVRAADFGELVARAEARLDIGLRAFAPPPPGKELSQQARLAPVACLRCGREADRVRFAQRHEIVVDVCPSHGTWFDTGELVEVLSFVRNRSEGPVPPTEAARAEEEAWEVALRRKRDEEIEVNWRVEHAWRHIPYRRK